MGNELMRFLLSHSAAVLLATVIVVPARGVAAAPAAQRDAAERIAEILEAQRSEQHIPGFAFALVRKDRLELVIVRGVRDVDRALPVNPWAQSLKAQIVLGREPWTKIDRLLFGAMVEARSCERFTRLLEIVEDPRAASESLRRFMAEAPDEKRNDPGWPASSPPVGRDATFMLP